MLRSRVLPLALLLASATALGDEDVVMVEVRQRFDRGVEFYEEGDFAAAHAEFERAYRLQPHPSVLVNLANCELKLGRTLQAARHFEQFLRDARDVPPSQIEEVRTALAQAREGLASLSFLVTPQGSTITLDLEPLGQMPEGVPMLVAPGRHVLRVVHPGYLTSERVIRLEPGQRAEVVVELLHEDVAHGRLEVNVDGSHGNAVSIDGQPAGQTPWSADLAIGSHDLEVATARGPYRGSVEVRRDRRVEVEIEVPPEVRDTRGRYLVLGAAAAGGLVAGSAVLGVLALSFENSFEESANRIETGRFATLEERDRLRRDGNSAADAAETLAVLSDVLWIGALALGAVTVSYYFAAEPVQEPPRAQIRLARSGERSWAEMVFSGRF